MHLSPIILFVYNRPEHTKKTINALVNNKLAVESTLIIFSDGFKNEKDIDNVIKVREVIKNISGFKYLKIVEREKNFGLANSVISGVTEIIEEYGKAIVLEDDILTSKYFLNFMNEFLDLFKKEKKIYSISGYNFPIKIHSSYQYQIYFSPRPSSWGWATWEDRWQEAIWEPEKIIDIYNKKELNKLLDIAGKDLAPMLLKSIDGKINSWAVKWAFTHLFKNTLSVYPIKSFTKNIGTDASGTNFINKTKRYDVEIADSYNNLKIVPELYFNDEIMEQIRRVVRPGAISFMKYRLFNIY